MKHGPYVEYEYKNWEDFLANNYYFANDMGFIFRGHGCSSWNLQTTLDRLLSRINPSGIELKSTRDFLLSEFVKSIRGRSSVNKDISLNNEELWALGQHYGLATPLLDWSLSIYVAAYFAFENHQIPSSGLRTIWAFHSGPETRKAIERYNESKEVHEHFKLIDPISDENPRLLSQTGLFTMQPLNFDFVKWVETEVVVDSPILIKINIPNGDRIGILKHLRLMNVHPGALFPDLEGAAKMCNQTIELLSHKKKQDDAKRIAKTLEAMLRKK